MIVIPMAGLSSRFTKAGYQCPKFELMLRGQTVFYHSVQSFQHYFNKEEILFIALEIPGIETFIETECKKLGLELFQVVILTEPTGGQAETVYEGLKKIGVSDTPIPLLIFNIDTFRPEFTYPPFIVDASVEGYLETFIGHGDNWSNVVPDTQFPERVKLTAEKQNLSEYCCTGLYYWRAAETFSKIFLDYKNTDKQLLQGNELYIAPMYNKLIEQDRVVNYSIIDKQSVIFCGTPDEYEKLKIDE